MNPVVRADDVELELAVEGPELVPSPELWLNVNRELDVDVAGPELKLSVEGPELILSPELAAAGAGLNLNVAGRELLSPVLDVDGPKTLVGVDGFKLPGEN